MPKLYPDYRITDHAMLHYLIQRLFSALLVMIGVTTLVFLLIHLIPGDPIEVMLGESATTADLKLLRQQLGLDQPLYQQWFNYIWQLLQFDLGVSLHSQQAISEILLQRLPATAWLALCSIVFAILIAFPVGILAAVKKDSLIDRLAMIFAIAGAAIPNFYLAPLLVLVFSILLGITPVSGMETAASIVLPAITLGTALAAIQSRMLRSSMLDVLHEPYITAARARGIGELNLIQRHALRNALIPTITILGTQVGALLTGAVVTEQIFDWPGIGQLTIEAIQKRDYPLVQACVLLISLTYVIINLLTDLAYQIIDPRIQIEQQGNH